MPGKLKMDEIAARTGYSISTVSRVLSGKSYTSEKAREAIVKCARQLGVLDSLANGRLLINGIAVFAPERTFQGRSAPFRGGAIPFIWKSRRGLPKPARRMMCGSATVRWRSSTPTLNYSSKKPATRASTR